MPKERKRIGEILVEKGKITEEQLRKALEKQKELGKYLGETLLELGYIREDDLWEALALQKKVPFIKLSRQEIKPEIVRIVPERLARRFNCLPIEVNGDVLTVAMADPTDVVAIDALRTNTGYEIKPVMASPKEISEALDIYHSEFADMEKSIQELVDIEVEKEGAEGEREDPTQLRLEANDAPVVRFVNLLLLQAVEGRASDLHLEPQEKGVSVRIRVDGILRNLTPPAKRMYSAIVSRIKILSGLDIGERRLPQDGRCKIRIGEREVDVRVSTLPTIYGEKVVMRLLDKSNILLRLEDLGFSAQDLTRFKKALSRPYGIILVTGPTGSGKTTTLYGALNWLNSPEKNIVTVEDPVEYELKGINQVQVKPGIGLSFATGLRSILRQDPNIIMVGEIRDLETAEIAVKAALTGHLVLSTLHTNNAIATVSRLIHMGIEPFLIVSSLRLVVAQRLIRRICPDCKEPFTPGEELKEWLGLKREEKVTLYRGKGCKLCAKTGYYGRIGIFEVFELTPRIRDMIMEQAPEDVLRKVAREEGMRTLREDGMEKILGGITTFEEVISATMEE